MDPIAPTDPANAEYARPCPTCRALPGQPCTYVGASRVGASMGNSHTMRRAIAPAPSPETEPGTVTIRTAGVTACLDFQGLDTVIVLEDDHGAVANIVGPVALLRGLVADLDSLLDGAEE